MIHIIVIYIYTSYNVIYNRYKLITNIIGNMHCIIEQTLHVFQIEQEKDH